MLRKLKLLIQDPVLRRWILKNLLTAGRSRLSVTRKSPPYISGVLPLAKETPQTPVKRGEIQIPDSPYSLPLAAETVQLQPDNPGEVFRRSFEDLETHLDLHRFTFAGRCDDAESVKWVCALWTEWMSRYAAVDSTWVWHPYTAAQRAINILSFARRFGVPDDIAGQTEQCLAEHCQAIAENLEYFGEAYTSNHLANNGRGLFIIGLSLGMSQAVEIGARILVEEAKRIFGPSGMLREGSSHYHALVVEYYRQAAEIARQHNHKTAPELERIVHRGLGALKGITLSGGLPCIGDISPDYPPQQLIETMEEAIEKVETTRPQELATDGWYPQSFGQWDALIFVSPKGWPPMPGHGHQDCGSFELHYGTLPLFVDPGRGSYGETGNAVRYRSSAVHNGLSLNGQDPYPYNRPYYDDAFRRSICGDDPQVVVTGQEVNLVFDGFSRLRNVGSTHRHWMFSEGALTIMDQVDGRGRRTIARRLVTALPVEHMDDHRVIITGEDQTFLVESDRQIRISEIIHWRRYGRGNSGSLLEIEHAERLPWRGTLTIQLLSSSPAS
jgi:hypothetical protein